MKIIKRNGSETVFDISKIITAIGRANKTVPESDRMTQEQIGEAMGISRSSVDHKLRTLGLSTGKRHDPEVEEV